MTRNVMLLLCYLLLHFYQVNACTGGTSNGTLTPGLAYATQSIRNGEYYTINVNSCDTYEFTFCGNGGTATWDTQLTLLDATGVTELSYSDDACGLQSSISWTSTLTGTVRILISKFNCDHDLTSTGTLAYKVTQKVGDFCITDNATNVTIGGKSCVQLTPESNNQKGCAWNDTQLDFNSDFTITTVFYFGNNINGADGSTITFQPSSPTLCGSTGGELGTGGLSNALVIEFDTYDNDNPTHAIDILADHIAIDIDGSLQNSTHQAGPIAAITGGANIDDGLEHDVEITWVKSTNTLNVYFDGALRLSSTSDFINTVFGGDATVYWGATASTGGLNNQQYFCPDVPVVLPTELNLFSNECKENGEIIFWEMASQNEIEHFYIQKSNDGKIFETISQIEMNYDGKYSVEIDELKRGNYYRLSMESNNGDRKNTGIISRKNCNKETTFVQNTYLNKSNLHVEYLELDSTIKLISMSGQLILEHNSGENTMEEIYIPSLSNGIYILQVENKNSTKKEFYKLYNFN